MARIASTTSAGVPVGPVGGMTLDALMARAKAAAERQGEIAAPRQIGSPWQGAAQMAQAFVNARQGAYAEDQASQGRQQLAQLLSGVDPEKGADPATSAQIYSLDPAAGRDVMQAAAEAIRAKRLREQTLADRAEGRTYQEGQTAATRKYEAGQEATINDRELKETQAAIAAANETEAQRNERELKEAQAATTATQAQEATVNERERLETIAAEERAALAKTEEEKRIAARPGTPQGKVLADYNNGAYGPVGSPEAIAMRDAAVKKENTTSSGGPQGLKVLYDQQDQYIGTQSAIGQLKRARDLIAQGISTGLTSGARTYAGNTGLLGGDEAAQASRTKEYNSIMRQEAITAMSQALKGATTDTEMGEFITNMNDPTLDPVVKGRMLDTMLAKATAFSETQAARIKAMDPDAELPQVKQRLEPQAEEQLLQSARDAIAKGADKALVAKRLVDKGADPGKL